MRNRFYPHPTPLPDTVIYRELSIGLVAFDRLKHWQRYLERKEDLCVIKTHPHSCLPSL